MYTYKSFIKTKKIEKSKRLGDYKDQGKVAEWMNAPVLKTDVVNSYRGFESLPSRLKSYFF